jgi:hypothetical protein
VRLKLPRQRCQQHRGSSKTGTRTLSRERRSSLPSLPDSWWVELTEMFFLNIVPAQPGGAGAACGSRRGQSGRWRQ